MASILSLPQYVKTMQYFKGQQCCNGTALHQNYSHWALWDESCSDADPITDNTGQPARPDNPRVAAHHKNAAQKTDAGFFAALGCTLTHLPQCRIYASVKWISIGSGNGFAPKGQQAITWNNAHVLSIDQSHRYGRHQAACREPAGSYDKTTRTAICFEHKMQYLLIRAPYARIMIFWHISNIPLWFRRVKLVVIPPRLESSNICEILLYNWQ